jgi:glycosyltransferase involved in cell wall biosynthesis
LLNVAYFSNQFADLEGHGLARYSRELFAALGGLDDVSVKPVASWSSIKSKELIDLQSETGLELLPFGRRLTPLCWTFLNRPKIEHWLDPAPDLVHAVSMGYPIATAKPLVVTVHDLGPITHPEYFQNTSGWIMRRSLEQTVSLAARIVCVSNSTADELISLVGDHIADRVVVVHEAVSSTFFEPVDFGCLGALDHLPEPGTPYVLSTGKLSPRKNVQGLIKAMASLFEDIPHHLVLVGGDGWNTEAIYSLLAQFPYQERIHFPGFVTDEQLRALYHGASVYVHPSLYEGFGLTLLEAMACDCPVVTSNTYSLPEVAGDAALLVDPASVNELASAVKIICNNETLAIELVEKGNRRVRKFSWENCAKEMADVYRMAVV